MLITHWLLLIIIGLCLGSFIGLVADRYPFMLYREWNITPESNSLIKRLAHLPSRFNLIVPRSHCTSCHNTLTWHHTVPILSFLLLRARCAYCQTPIPRRTFFSELISALLCVLAVSLFDWSPHAFMLIILYLALLTLTLIDLEHQLLPDTITLSLLWIALIAQLYPTLSPISSSDAISGAVIGYLTPWLVGALFKAYRKKPGLGLGDCKLLAALGAWSGPMDVLLILLAAAFLGLIVAGLLISCRKLSSQSFIPFGPFIAIIGAIIITLQWLGVPIPLLLQ